MTNTYSKPAAAGMIFVVDDSYSTKFSAAYKRMVREILDHLVRMGVRVILVAASSTCRMAHTVPDAYALLEHPEFEGTDPHVWVQEIKGIPEREQYDLILVTDGEVNMKKVEACERLSFRSVTVHLCEIYPGCVNMSIASVFTSDCESARVFLVNFDRLTGEAVTTTVTTDVDTASAGRNLQKLLRNLTGEPSHRMRTCEDLRSLFPSLALVVKGSSKKYHDLREMIIKARDALQRTVRTDKPIAANLEITMRTGGSFSSLATIVAFLNDYLSELGKAVVKLGLSENNTAPPLSQRGTEVEDVGVPEEFRAEYTTECGITFTEETTHVVPLTEFPGEMSNAFITNPMAACKALKQMLTLPMSANVYNVMMKGSSKKFMHPFARRPVVAAIPLSTDLNADVLKSQLAKALFGGNKMVGLWSMWMPAIYVASLGVGFLDNGVREALRSLAVMATQTQMCNISGTPTVPHPAFRSTVLLSMQFCMLSWFLGYDNGDVDRLRTLCMLPGQADAYMKFLENVEDEHLDPLFLENVDRIWDVIPVYESYAALHKYLKDNPAVRARDIASTLIQNNVFLPHTTPPLLVLLGGPGNLDFVRSVVGVTCAPGVALALCDILESQGTSLNNRADVKSILNGLPDLKAMDENAVTKDHVMTPPLKNYREATDLNPATCRPQTCRDPEGKLKPYDAKETYGDASLPLHNWFGRYVESYGEFPSPEQLLAYACFLEKCRDGSARVILASESLEVCEVVVREFDALRSANPELNDVTEFSRRFLASKFPKDRADIEDRASAATVV